RAQRFPPGRPTDSVVRDGRVRFVCPYIPLSGTWEQYLEALGRRENLRRREKWLYRQPGVSVSCARTAEGAVKATEEFLQLHRARWAVEGDREVDFVGGSEGCKAEWSRGERWTIQVRLWRGARGRAARAALGATVFTREAVKAALPRRVLGMFRKVRRVLRAPLPEGEN